MRCHLACHPTRLLHHQTKWSTQIPAAGFDISRIIRPFVYLTYLLGFDKIPLLGSKTPWQRGAAAVSGNCRLAPNESETDEPELDISSRAATLWHWTHTREQCRSRGREGVDFMSL